MKTIWKLSALLLAQHCLRKWIATCQCLSHLPQLTRYCAGFFQFLANANIATNVIENARDAAGWKSMLSASWRTSADWPSRLLAISCSGRNIEFQCSRLSDRPHTVGGWQPPIATSRTKWMKQNEQSIIKKTRSKQELYMCLWAT